MWIDHRSYPGSPLGYIAATETDWFNVLGQIPDAAANILGESEWRCFTRLQYDTVYRNAPSKQGGSVTL
jgi:hypothetical protein